MWSRSHKSWWQNFHQFPGQQDPAPWLRHSLPASSQHLPFLDLLLERRNFCVYTRKSRYIYTHIFLHSVPSVLAAKYTHCVLQERARSPPPAHPHQPRHAPASWYIPRWKFLIPGIMLHYGRNCCTSACFTSGLRDRTKRMNAFQRLDDVSSVRRTHSIIAISVW